MLGPTAERRFGRRNFMELFAVFSSPQSYTVQTGDGKPLGSLNQEFVDRLVDGVSCFLLGGRAWAVLEVRHDDRRVVVCPAPRGQATDLGRFPPAVPRRGRLPEDPRRARVRGRIRLPHPRSRRPPRRTS